MASSRLKLEGDKTEVLWIGSRGALNKSTGIRPEVRVGSSRIEAAYSARLLGITVTPDLMLGKQVMAICAQCFCQLRQLRTVRRSLDEVSAATLVRAFVASRVDYRSCLLAGSSKQLTDKLQRVMNAAIRLVTGTRKFERGLARPRHDDLLWLDVAERIQFRLASTVYRCLRNMAPAYLAALCLPVAAAYRRYSHVLPIAETLSCLRGNGLRPITEQSSTAVTHCMLDALCFTYRKGMGR
jgi:hypothetical protein